MKSRYSHRRGHRIANDRNVRSRSRCSKCPAIRINSHSWLHSSSTHKLSDPPFKVIIIVTLATSACLTDPAFSARFISFWWWVTESHTHTHLMQPFNNCQNKQVQGAHELAFWPSNHHRRRPLTTYPNCISIIQSNDTSNAFYASHV